MKPLNKMTTMYAFKLWFCVTLSILAFGHLCSAETSQAKQTAEKTEQQDSLETIELDAAAKPFQAVPKAPNFNPGKPPQNKRPLTESKRQQYSQQVHQENLKVIERFIDMPPEKIAMIRSLLEKLETMTPEERKEMKKQIREFKSLPQEKRARIVKDFNKIPLEERVALRSYWKSLPPEEAKAERQKIKKMSPEERRAYRKELAAKYADPNFDRKRKRLNDRQFSRNQQKPSKKQNLETPTTETETETQPSETSIAQ